LHDLKSGQKAYYMEGKKWTVMPICNVY